MSAVARSQQHEKAGKSPFSEQKITPKPIGGYEFSDPPSNTDSKMTGYSLFLNEKSIFITVLFLCTDPTAL